MKVIYLFLFAALTLFSCANRKNKPNIILIMADDLGYADISCLGVLIINGLFAKATGNI